MPNVAPPVYLEWLSTSLNLYYTTYSAMPLLGPSIIQVIRGDKPCGAVWFDLAPASLLSPMIMIRMLVKLIRGVKYRLLVLSYSISYVVI